MVDKNSAPSYSISGSTNLLKSSKLPGPGAYDARSYFKVNTSLDTYMDKKFSQSKQKRFSEYGSVAPGPGTYDNKIPSHIQTVRILSKSKAEKTEKVPGPGAYDPHYQTVVKSASSYKVGTANKLSDLTRGTRYIPGPGQYQTAKSTLTDSRHHVSTFGPERKIQLAYNPKTPGPGQYNQALHYNGSVVTQPKAVFGKESRSHSMKSLIPGPGTYSVKGELDEKNKGFKMGERISTKPSDRIPGPGAYVPLIALKTSAPSFSMGKQTKLKIQNLRQSLAKPGPLAYDVKVSALSSQSFMIGKDKRKGLQNLTKVPGPGTYEYKTINTSQTFTLPKSSRKPIADFKATPSPFQYNPKISYNNQYQSVGITSDHRRTFDIKQTSPGPANYNYSDKKSNGYSIGKQKRSTSKDQRIPGPGQYQIPSTISNVPTYLSNSKH